MCGRKYFTIHDVKKDTYICSLHFIGGKGPTDEHPDPVKCGTQVIYSVLPKGGGGGGHKSIQGYLQWAQIDF